MDINKKILKYLEEKGISHSVIVKKTGISKQNLSRILSSDDLKVSQLIEISKALSVPTTYFFDSGPTASNEEIKNYIEKITELTEDLEIQKRIAKGYMNFVVMLGGEIEEIEKKNIVIPDEVKEIFEEINSTASILGLVDGFSEVLSKNKEKKIIMGAVQIPEKAKSLQGKKPKSKK